MLSVVGLHGGWDPRDIMAARTAYLKAQQEGACSLLEFYESWFNQAVFRRWDGAYYSDAYGKLGENLVQLVECDVARALDLALRALLLTTAHFSGEDDSTIPTLATGLAARQVAALQLIADHASEHWKTGILAAVAVCKHEDPVLGWYMDRSGINIRRQMLRLVAQILDAALQQENCSIATRGLPVVLPDGTTFNTNISDSQCEFAILSLEDAAVRARLQDDAIIKPILERVRARVGKDYGGGTTPPPPDGGGPAPDGGTPAKDEPPAKTKTEPSYWWIMATGIVLAAVGVGVVVYYQRKGRHAIP